jgi:hypothetical protein
MRRFLLTLTLVAGAAVPAFATTATTASAGTNPTGYFVVGDVSAASAGNHVEFWGAQWAKDNTLSGGSASAAFKGYAVTVDDPNCPQHWTADPGNSTPPPASVDGDIVVIVTSHATKSGNTISGDIVKFVRVHTDGGYEGNPGHAGTGVVGDTIAVGSCNDNNGNL